MRTYFAATPTTTLSFLMKACQAKNGQLKRLINNQNVLQQSHCCAINTLRVNSLVFQLNFQIGTHTAVLLIMLLSNNKLDYIAN